jgi:CheY-like chemotaxis protein
MAKKIIKILMVEDDPDQSVLYQTKFQLEGFKVELAKNGIEGLAKAESFKPDFILLDILMSDMSGIEVLQRLRKNPRTKDITVAIFTNMITKELKSKAEKLKAVGFWPKTQVMPQEVVDRIKQTLGVK